jgi:hypothetical protein
VNADYGPTRSYLTISNSEGASLRTTLLSRPLASVTAHPATTSPALRGAWDSYHAALEELRAELEGTSIFERPQARASMYHLLMELQAQAYNAAIAPRLSAPRVHSNTGWQTDMYTIGIAGADIYYGLAFVDGTKTYRLSGRLGDIKLFLLQVVSHTFGSPDSRTLGTFNLADMDVGADGRFVVTLGGPGGTENWVPLDPSSAYNFVMIRRILLDPGYDDSGELTIRQVGEEPSGHHDVDEFSEEAMAARVRRAEMLMRGLVRNIAIGIHDLIMAAADGQRNRMVLLPGETGVGGSPLCLYSWGVFSLESDQALILKIDSAPDSEFWSVQLGDIWSRALPYHQWQTSLNSAQAARDPDGCYRFVISSRDPGIANWLDTCGRSEGQILFRNYIATDATVPSVRKVALDNVGSHLPLGVRRVSTADRKVAIAYRRRGYLNLYGE